jgi:hypothetical protein
MSPCSDVEVTPCEDNDTDETDFRIATQRFKESGMTWSTEGGEVILRLRLAVLSGVWEEVYSAFLNHRPLVPLATQLTILPQTDQNAA